MGSGGGGGEGGGCGCRGGFGWARQPTQHILLAVSMNSISCCLNTYSWPCWPFYALAFGTTAWPLGGEWDCARGEAGEAIIYANIVSLGLQDNCDES